MVPAQTFVNVRVEAPRTRVGGASNYTATDLQKNACNEVCTVQKPTVCKTCSDKRLSADQGEVKFTDFRVDIVGQGYRLTFFSISFTVLSKEFDVENASPSYIMIQRQPSAINYADSDLQIQPVVSMHDKYGNLILRDSSFSHTVEVILFTKGGLPSAAGFPDVPGQEPDTICTVSDEPLAGMRVIKATDGVAVFSDLSVRPVMSGFSFVFLATISKGVLNVTSDEFSVAPGPAVGICNMTLPRRCSGLSPCLDNAQIACIDAYGNVQPTCTTSIGSSKGLQPFGTVPVGMSDPCFGKVCVSIISPASGKLHQGASMTTGIDCHTETCGADIDQKTGFAFFTQILLDIPSPLFIFKFSTFVIDPKSRLIYEWTYISPAIENRPPAPILLKASFSVSFSSILLSFSRATNMNVISEEKGSDACAAVLDKEFLLTIGIDPACTWTDPQSYLIVMGKEDRVNERTTVLLNNASYIVYSDTFLGFHMTSPPATTSIGAILEGAALVPVKVSLPSLLPTPVPIVMGPQYLSACDLLSLDASLSQASASRPFTLVKWSLNYDRTFLYRGLLEHDGSLFEFLNRHIHFSTLLPNSISTVTITLRPSAPVQGNSTISISGLPNFYPSSLGCPTRTGYLARPCLVKTDRCMVLDVTGPSAFKFASHLNAHRQASRENVAASWWQVGTSQMFKKLDIDLSQTISLQEFTTCLRDTDDYVSAARTLARFKNIDSNSDGAVDDIEFMGKRPINGTFVSIDTNSSKTITEPELLAAVNKTGDFVRDTQIRNLLVSLDVDESGYIDEFEFNSAPCISMAPAQLMYPPSAFQGLDSGFKLQVHASHYLTAGDDTVIQFKIQNPPLPWTATAIMISSLCPGCICKDGKCKSQTFATQAMQMELSAAQRKVDETKLGATATAPGEYALEDSTVTVSGLITETTRVLGARNALTIYFQTSHVLPASSGIVLKGLPLPDQLPAGVVSSLCLRGPSAVHFLCRSCASDGSGSPFGTWHMDSGQIYLRVKNGSSVPAGNHELSWRFYNPTKSLRTTCRPAGSGTSGGNQGCPSKVRPTLHVSYEYEKAASTKGVELDSGALGVLGAGQPPAWTRAQISESNRYNGALSHLFLELEANVELPQFTRFTVRGFPGRNNSYWGRDRSDPLRPFLIATPQNVRPIWGLEAQDGNMKECFDPSKVFWNAEGTEISWQLKHVRADSSCFLPAGRPLRLRIPIVNSLWTTPTDDSALRSCPPPPPFSLSRARALSLCLSLPLSFSLSLFLSPPSLPLSLYLSLSFVDSSC